MVGFSSSSSSASFSAATATLRLLRAIPATGVQALDNGQSGQGGRRRDAAVVCWKRMAQHFVVGRCYGERSLKFRRLVAPVPLFHTSTQIRSCHTIVQSFRSGNAATLADYSDWTAWSCEQYYPATPIPASKTCDSIFWWYANGNSLWWQDYVDWCTYQCNTKYPCGLGRSCDSIACTLSKVFRISEKDLADWTRLSCVSFYPDINPSDGLKCNLIQNTCAVGQIVSTLDSDYMEHSGWFCFFGYRLGGRTEVKEATRIAKMAVKQAAIAQEGLVRTLQAATGAEAAAAALVGEEAASKAAWAAKVVERAKNSLLLDVKEELALQWMADSATVSAARARNSAFKAKLAADWAAGVAAARQGHPE